MNSATIQARIWKAYGRSAKILGESYKFYHSSEVNTLLGEDGRPVLSELGAEIHLETNRYLLDENGNRILGVDGRPLLIEAPLGEILTEDGQRILTEDGSAIVLEKADASVPSPLTTPPYATQFVSLNAEDMNYKKPNKYGKATWYALFDAKNAVVGDYFVGNGGTFFIATLQLLLPILAVECNRVVTVFRPQIQTGADGEYGGTTATNQTAIMTNWPCSILQGTKGEKNESNLPGDSRAAWWAILIPYAGVQILPNDRMTDDLGINYVVSSTEMTGAGWRLTAMTAIA